MQATDATFGPGWVSIAVQALGFGVWHFYGFPGGVVGVGLATIFAAMMGVLRRRSRGMLVPWLAHTCADATIITIIVVHTYGT
jgi:membrane protease YdiL (CAAX protease family)